MSLLVNAADKPSSYAAEQSLSTVAEIFTALCFAGMCAAMTYVSSVALIRAVTTANASKRVCISLTPLKIEQQLLDGAAARRRTGHARSNTCDLQDQERREIVGTCWGNRCWWFRRPPGLTLHKRGRGAETLGGPLDV